MFEHHKRKKKIARAAALTPDTPDGTEVGIRGRVRVLDRTLSAPASGRLSVICAVRAVDRAPHEPGGWAPAPDFATVDACPFVLDREDGGGSVVVASDFVELVDIDVANIDEPVAQWDTYCIEHGLTVGRAKEAVVQPGDWITIVGVLERRPVPPGAEAGFRETGTATYVVGDFDHPLLVASAAHDS